VLLMLHGNPTWSFVYRDTITQLISRFRCVAPDNPGFGFPVVPDGFDGNRSPGMSTSSDSRSSWVAVSVPCW
jgi:pimeloyl-ACP methyl ester carboxylesterase